MGKLIWYEYSRLVSLTACIYTVWACFWGFFYRKFFWDFVGGTLRDPGGLQPSPKVSGFIKVIVTVPVIQALTMAVALFLIALDFPFPPLKTTRIYRSFAFRIVLLILQAFMAVLIYQATNGALWSLIAAGCYTRAQMLGETMADAKENRGKSGKAWFFKIMIRQFYMQKDNPQWTGSIFVYFSTLFFIPGFWL